MAQPLYEIISFEANGADPLPLAHPFTTIPNIQAVHLGLSIESPTTSFLILKHASPSSARASLNPSHPARQQIQQPLCRVSFIAPDAEIASETDAALAAPTTEVVTIAAVVEGFTERNMAPFKRACLAHGDGEGMKGYYAWGYGDAEEGAEGLEMPGAVMLLGWESKGAHEAAKVKGGPIDSNLAVIESNNKGVFVHHVPFQRL